MGVSKSIRRLAALTDQLEATENEISELTLQDTDLLNGDKLEADLTVDIPLVDRSEVPDVDIRTTETTVTDDGTISIELSIHIPERVETKDATEQENPKASGVTDGGTVETSKTPPAGSETIASESSAEMGTETAGEGNRAPYKNPERLAEVYDADSTFAEMTDALDVDVTPQTVRNYMIEYGIHDPNKNTSRGRESEDDKSFLGDAEGHDLAVDETAVAIADDIELPDDLTLSGVTEAVSTAKTLYEVQRELGIKRDQTRRILSELNLLELVHGRVATTSARTKSKEEIEQRIQEAVANTERTN